MMWPFKHRWTPPNAALTEEAFTSPGGFRMWEAIGDMRERVARVEGTLIVLVALVLAILGLAIAQVVG